MRGWGTFIYISLHNIKCLFYKTQAHSPSIAENICVYVQKSDISTILKALCKITYSQNH